MRVVYAGPGSSTSNFKPNSLLSKILAQPKKSSFAVDDGSTVHFLVTSSKGPNYTSFCDETVESENSVSTIRQYTDHASELYSKVNFSLAADSPSLAEIHTYIKQLRASVLATPLLDDCALYRGVELSQIEIDKMEELGKFFIPSFTSTSIDSTKAYDKNSTLCISTTYLSRYACTITPELSDYYGSEKEVLIACYSAFKLQRVEKVGSKNIISLFLDEFGSSCGTL